VYVGSSEKLHQRLKVHFGLGSTKTYTRQLAHWAMHKKIRTSIECAKYGYAVTREALQVLEEALWSEKRPMFCKKGAK
jgi:hypothetical protein